MRAGERGHGNPHEHGRGDEPISKDLLDFSTSGLGQTCPRDYPQAAEDDPLGAPLSLRQVASLIGCSPWTVRHRYLQEGLPHFRTMPTGKLIFYRNQVIRWVLTRQQQKGGA